MERTRLELSSLVTTRVYFSFKWIYSAYRRRLGLFKRHYSILHALKKYSSAFATSHMVPDSCICMSVPCLNDPKWHNLQRQLKFIFLPSRMSLFLKSHITHVISSIQAHLRLHLGTSHMHTGFRSFNTLRPRPNFRHYTDNILECILLNECLLKVSLKFVPQVRINNIRELAQIMAWRLPGDKHYLDQWWLVYWRIYTSLGLNELNLCGLVTPYNDIDLSEY